jgi:hypothetical protein
LKISYQLAIGGNKYLTTVKKNIISFSFLQFACILYGGVKERKKNAMD